MKSEVTPCAAMQSRHMGAVRNLKLATLMTTALLVAPVTNADQVRIPLADNVRVGQQQSLPQMGDTRESVESRFGAPERQTGAVGTPPITQWHYPDFVVYFEYDHVVHAVAKR